MPMKRYAVLAITLAAMSVTLLDLAGAQEGASFAGKTVTIYVGYGPGGGYDLYARVLSRHLGRHLPGNPAVVVSNMPGAGSIRAANYVYSVAPKDGTALGIVAQSIAEEQLLGTSGVNYDVTKFAWIGRFAANVEAAYVWHQAPIRTIEDLKTTEATFAGTGPTSVLYPRLLNSIAGMKWKVVQGYNTTAVAHLAMQRREVDGATSSLNTLKTTQQDWLDGKLIHLIVLFSVKRSGEFPNVPAVVEFGNTQDEKDLLRFYANSGTVGRAVIAPPAMAADRIALLRKAFDDTVKDPDFRTDIATTKLEFEPMAGADLQSIVEASTKVSDSVIARAKAARTQ